MRKTQTDIPKYTGSLDTREIDAEKLLLYFDQLNFSYMPDKKGDTEDTGNKSWRIVMINLVTRQDPLALEIWDEFVIGRRIGDPEVDLDLSIHNGLELGVSRIHAAIRPTEDSLLLFDKNSTNGTFCNANKATKDEPVKVKDNDIISFGALKFLVKVVRKPKKKATTQA